MDDKYLDVLKSISNRVDASLKQSQELQRQREKTKMMTNNAPRPVKPKSRGTLMSKNVQRPLRRVRGRWDDEAPQHQPIPTRRGHQALPGLL